MSMTQIDPFGILFRPTSAWQTSPWVQITVPAPVAAASEITSERPAPSASAGVSSTSMPSAAASGSTVPMQRAAGLVRIRETGKPERASGSADACLLPRRSSGRSRSSPLHFRRSPATA